MASRLARALAGLKSAAAAGAGLALLPEEFAGAGGPFDGFPNDSVTRALGAVAVQHRMYVAFGVRLPATEADNATFSDLGNLGFNTAVILDRETGEPVARYRKQFPCCVDPSGNVGADGYPSREGTPAWDLPGIGRVAVLTCYDANFEQAWQGAYAQRADLVLWPSAYGGGLALRSYAALYHYHIVPNGWGDVRGLTGDVVPSLRQVRIFFFLACARVSSRGDLSFILFFPSDG